MKPRFDNPREAILWLLNLPRTKEVRGEDSIIIEGSSLRVLGTFDYLIKQEGTSIALNFPERGKHTVSGIRRHA